MPCPWEIILMTQYKRQRKSIRLNKYDYTAPGAYLVTIRIQNGACLFGEIVDANMMLNEIGDLVSISWQEIPSHFSNVRLDRFVVMPNHLHGIIIMDENFHTL